MSRKCMTTRHAVGKVQLVFVCVWGGGGFACTGLDWVGRRCSASVSPHNKHSPLQP